jgi:hypothetical protein
MIFGILTLITALSISAVAIYYSVAGLVAIFASAPLAIMIMGGILEVSKLVTAVWLHKYWHRTVWWLKTYLAIAVVVLMFITSMGIFGFLSRAHIEQTASAETGIAQIERIAEALLRQEQIIARAETRIETTLNSDNNRDAELQKQITLEQDRLDAAYERIQPAIDEQNRIVEQETAKLEQRIEPLQVEINSITTVLDDLQAAINSNDIRKAQGIVGTSTDGRYGPSTARAVDDFRTTQTQRRDNSAAQIDSLRAAPNVTVEAARAEISRLRSLAEEQISASNTLLERLRSQLGQGDDANVEQVVEEQRTKIIAANTEIDTLTDEKFKLEAEYRKLEAEVGPIKYIAEFIYGSADQNLLEEAVRWVIILIIFVFDPLAVLLLIASQYTFEYYRKDNPKPQTRKPAPDPAPEDIVVYSLADNAPYYEPDPVEVAEDYRMSEIRRRQYAEKEKSQRFLSEKEQWKHDHPHETLKLYKNLFIQGKIDSLPWEGYNPEDN